MAEGRPVLSVDMGGVFFGYSFERAIAGWAERAGVPYADLLGRFRIDAEFDRFEQGRIEPGEYLEHLRRILGVALADDELTAAWNSIYGDVDLGLVELLGEVSEDWAVIGMSNTNRLHAEAWRERFREHLPVFRTVYCSHEIGCTKPNLDFFEHLVSEQGSSLGQLTVVDDIPIVVERARGLGIRGHVYRGAADLRSALLEAGALLWAPSRRWPSG